MSEPIPDVAGIPDVIAARALPALVELLYTEPVARPLVATGALPIAFAVDEGELEIRCYNTDRGTEQLAAAQALFGNDISAPRPYGTSALESVVTSTWQGVPLKVTVKLAREDELAALRKQVADLQGRLVEQRHQLLDPAVPPLSAAGRDVPPLELTTVQAPAELAVAE
jgi:hypothetical protein